MFNMSTSLLIERLLSYGGSRFNGKEIVFESDKRIQIESWHNSFSRLGLPLSSSSSSQLLSDVRCLEGEACQVYKTYHPNYNKSNEIGYFQLVNRFFRWRFEKISYHSFVGSAMAVPAIFSPYPPTTRHIALQIWWHVSSSLALGQAHLEPRSNYAQKQSDSIELMPEELESF